MDEEEFNSKLPWDYYSGLPSPRAYEQEGE